MMIRRLMQVLNPTISTVPRPLALCYRFNSTNTETEEQWTQLYEKLRRPAQPLRPFIRFLMKYRVLFKTKYPTANLYELYNRIASVWFQLSPDVKKQYHDSYWEEAVDYYARAQKFNAIESEEKQALLETEKDRKEEIREKRRIKLLKKISKIPKRSGNAYLMYLMKKYKENEKVGRNSEVNVTEFARIVGAEWRSMSTEDRKIYEDEAVKQSQKYTKEKQNWECDIIKKGYAHLLPKEKFFDLRPTNRDRRRKIVPPQMNEKLT